MVVRNGPDGRPLLHGDEDVVVAGQAERVGVGAQRPEGLDAVVLLPDVAALESLHDGVAQPGPGRRLGDGELGALAGQPERAPDVRHGRRHQVRATLSGAVAATTHHGVPSVDKQTPIIVVTGGFGLAAGMNSRRHGCWPLRRSGAPAGRVRLRRSGSW